jgi:hypothetical protein
MKDIVIRIVVESAIGGLILVVGWLTGRSSSEHPAVGAKVLGYSTWFRGAAILSGVIAPVVVLAAVIVQPPADPDDFWGLIAFAVGMVVVGGFLMIEGFRTKVVITREGIAKFSWHSSPVYFPWDEVDKVYPGQLGGWVVRHESGRKLGFDPSTMGPRTWFAQACREYLPAEKYPEVFNRINDD